MFPNLLLLWLARQIQSFNSTLDPEISLEFLIAMKLKSFLAPFQCLCREAQTNIKWGSCNEIKIWALPHPGPYRWFLTCQAVFPSSQKLTFECILQATSPIANLFTVFPSNAQPNPAELLIWPQLATTICWLGFFFPQATAVQQLPCTKAVLIADFSSRTDDAKTSTLQPLSHMIWGRMGKDRNRQDGTFTKTLFTWR